MAETYKVAIRYHLNTDKPAVFSDSALVQNEEGAFIISFFQVVQPIIEKGGPRVETVDAHPVARVVLPPKVFEALLAAMQDNLKTYRETYPG